jgi:hypothetical protein
MRVFLLTICIRSSKSHAYVKRVEDVNFRTDCYFPSLKEMEIQVRSLHPDCLLF